MALVLLGTSSCATNTVDVLQRADPAYDFSSHRTYMWAGLTPSEALPSRAPDPEKLDAEIRAAVEKELASKGFRPAQPADLHVSYRVHVSDRVPASDDPPPSAWDPSTDVTKYASAAFLVDFVDRETQSTVWRGAALTDIQPGEGRKRVDEVVARVLQDFPPAR